MTLSFDSASHTYTDAGRVLPSVTQIIRAVFGDVSYGTDWHLERGRAVHACYAMLAREEKFDPDPRCTPWIEGWLKWYAEVRPVILSVERPVSSCIAAYAGTADLIAEIDGKCTIVDFKNSASWRDRYQLAGYGCTDELSLVEQAVTVEISGDGNYKMVPIIKGAEWRKAKIEWVSIVNVYRIIQKEGA